jgi:hypothetical protein
MSQPATPPDDELGVDLNDPDVQAWFEQHLTDLRKGAYGQRFLYWTLGLIFLVGLVAYVVGYFLRTEATTEPFGLFADLIYTLGFALWTAAVVVVAVELVPEAKRRQIRSALEAYEAIRQKKAPPTETDAAPRSEGVGS